MPTITLAAGADEGRLAKATGDQPGRVRKNFVPDDTFVHLSRSDRDRITPATALLFAALADD